MPDSDPVETPSRARARPTDERLPVYLIAAPIGNHLDDMSSSAFDAVGVVRHLFVEELGARLLDKLGAAGHLTDEHELIALGPSAPARALALVDAGVPFGILANSGLPCFIDPGFDVVRALQGRADRVRLVPVGMSSALDAAMTMSGLDLHKFVFLGHWPASASFDRALVDSYLPLVWYVAGRDVRGFVEQVRQRVPNLARLLLFRNIRSLSTQRTWVLAGGRWAVPDDLVDGEHDNFVAIVEPGKQRRFDTD